VGAITGAEAECFKWKNVLVRYLGNAETSTQGPDLRVLTVEPGDRYLLCSDGLSGVVSAGDVLHCVEEVRAVQQCAEALGRLALESGSRDNVSCVVVEVVRRGE
jgi:protein phosphatase